MGHSYLGRVWCPQLYSRFPSPGFKGDHTTCVLQTDPVLVGWFVVFCRLNIARIRSWTGSQLFLIFFCIYLCNYTTNYKTVNCIPVGEILLLQTLDHSEKRMVYQTIPWTQSHTIPDPGSSGSPGIGGHQMRYSSGQRSTCPWWPC